jgi:hypothetical protein
MHIFYVSDKIQYFQTIIQFDAKQGFSSLFTILFTVSTILFTDFTIMYYSILPILHKFPSCAIAKNPLLSFRFLYKK